MTCQASAADTQGTNQIAAVLDCDIQLASRGGQSALRGTLVGSGIGSATLGGVQMRWNVLAPLGKVQLSDLIGTYDAVSEYHLKLADKRGVLVGGSEDKIALELVAPAPDILNASSRLTLER